MMEQDIADKYDLSKVKNPELVSFMNDLSEIGMRMKENGELDASVDGMKKDFDTYYGGRNNLD